MRRKKPLDLAREMWSECANVDGTAFGMLYCTETLLDHCNRTAEEVGAKIGAVGGIQLHGLAFVFNICVFIDVGQSETSRLRAVYYYLCDSWSWDIMPL
jgi:hypothetical protein